MCEVEAWRQRIGVTTTYQVEGGIFRTRFGKACVPLLPGGAGKIAKYEHWQFGLDYLDDTPRYPKRDRDEQRMQTVSS